MDDDAVLRSLDADLEREDPRLAAFLSGRARSPRRHVRAWLLLLLLPALAVPVAVAPTVTLAAVTMVMALSAPLVVCWWCTSSTGGPSAAGPPTGTPPSGPV